jgi:hypothetical protein
MKNKNKIFLIFKEIKNGAVAKQYMRRGLLIYEEMSKYLTLSLAARAGKKMSYHIKSHCKVVLIYKILKKICNSSLLSKNYFVLSYLLAKMALYVSFFITSNINSIRSRPEGPKYGKKLTLDTPGGIKFI